MFLFIRHSISIFLSLNQKYMLLFHWWKGVRPPFCLKTAGTAAHERQVFAQEEAQPWINTSIKPGYTFAQQRRARLWCWAATDGQTRRQTSLVQQQIWRRGQAESATNTRVSARVSHVGFVPPPQRLSEGGGILPERPGSLRRWQRAAQQGLQEHGPGWVCTKSKDRNGSAKTKTRATLKDLLRFVALWGTGCRPAFAP